MEDQSESLAGAQRTLKRGDACLACRKRRIKCGAEKPACTTCSRLGKECLYETVKPPSRIAKLKGRIAELEEHISSVNGEGSTPRRSSSSDLPAEDREPQTSSTTTNGNMSFNFNPFEQSHDGSFTQLPFGRPSPNFPPPHDPMPMGPPSNGFSVHPDLRMLQEGHHFAHQTQSHQAYPYQSSNPRPTQAPDPNFQFDFSLLDPSMMDLASAFNIFNNNTGPAMPQPCANPITGTESAFSPLSGRASSMSDMLDYDQEIVDELAQENPFIRLRPKLAAQYRSGTPSHTGNITTIALHGDSQHGPSPRSDFNSGLVGGWFDPDDVPSSVRDHLLDLHFSSVGASYSASMSVPRFYTRLTLAPSKRPHQGLMYMMYVFGARQSTQAALRALEGRFYEIAQTRIQAGIKDGDRMLDLIRALVMLTGYQVSKEWFNLGYTTAGMAIRLAISCGLHRIPSSTPLQNSYKFNAAVHFTLRTGGYALPPPEDALELGERIHTFWAVYEVDVCTSIAYLWDPGFDMNTIMTPLPRNLEDYALGLVSDADDIRLPVILDDPHHDSGKPYRAVDSVLSLRVLASTYLCQATRLMHSPGEGIRPCDPQYQIPMPGRYTKQAFETHPKTCAHIKKSLDALWDRMPKEQRLPWERWDEGEFDPDASIHKVDKFVAILWFIMGNAYLTLWNIRSLSSDNRTALLIARRAAAVIGVYIEETLLRGYDAFIICLWNWVAMVLLREVKRLEVVSLESFLTNEQQTTFDSINAALDKVTTVLKGRTSVLVFESVEAVDIAALNTKMIDQLRAMPVADWKVAMVESDKRWV